MSYSEIKAFRPCSPSTSDHESSSANKPTTIPNNTKDVSIKSPVPNANNCHALTESFRRNSSDGDVSDVSTHSSLAGGKLTEAPGRLTPTCPGRMKAPPVCRSWALKRGASNIQDIECFSPEEAERCSEKCLVLVGGNEMNVEDIPFNIEESEPVTAAAGVRPFEGKPHVSSSSTVVTNTSGGAGGVQAVAPGSAKKDPPLEVVRTDDCVLNSEDEAGCTEENAKKVMSSPPSSPKPPPPSFTDKLIKDHQSRQGRSLQRWLMHSQTEALVREVAGSVPISRDGRIVLVSASRKNEWILPKGGWDSDETKEECAVRETYEEAGLLGRLGSCLAPIDYESGKSKKRRLEGTTSPEVDSKNASVKLESDCLPPLAKKPKKEFKDCKSIESDSSPDHGQESSKPSFIRLLLFPLYLTEVKSDWPEKGRLRKLVDIDEAIRIMEKENRLYFKKGLEVVKEMGLHLVHQHDGEVNGEIKCTTRGAL